MAQAAVRHKAKVRYGESERPSSTDRGYGWRWLKIRRRFLRLNPLCAKHLEQGQIVAAVAVDHIKPHRGDPKLLYDWNNLQSLCIPCHNKKSCTERHKPVEYLQG